MPKIKTSELIDQALDWAVAVCEKYDGWNPESDWKKWPAPKFSTDWAQGGPIIERELFELFPFWKDGVWNWVAFVDENYEKRGPTTLIAAMRCYVASKLGEEIEIPKELL